MCLSAIIWANIKKVYYGNMKEDAENIGDPFDDDCDNEPIEIEFEKLENSRIVLSDKVKEIFKNISKLRL